MARRAGTTRRTGRRSAWCARPCRAQPLVAARKGRGDHRADHRDPLAVAVALFITHDAPRRLTQSLGYLIELLAAEPQHRVRPRGYRRATAFTGHHPNAYVHDVLARASGL